MTRIGPTVVVRGDVTSTDDINVEGRIEGPIWCEGHALTIAPGAVVDGDIVEMGITGLGGQKNRVVDR